PEIPTADVTAPGTVAGTLQYMSPEQLEGAEADARTDIFAFGALLHEMLTGRKAFDGKTQVLLMSAIAASQPEPPSKIQPAIPAAFENVVEVCLAKNPDERWQTARDLLTQLQWVSDSVGAVGEAQARQSAALSHDRPGSQKTSAWRLRVGVASAAVLLLAVAV